MGKSRAFEADGLRYPRGRRQSSSLALKPLVGPVADVRDSHDRYLEVRGPPRPITCLVAQRLVPALPESIVLGGICRHVILATVAHIGGDCSMRGK